MDKFADRVAAGARLLDEYSERWWEDVDLDRLDLSSCTQCVMGQLFGEYGDGLDHFYSEHLEGFDGVEDAFEDFVVGHGFDLASSVTSLYRSPGRPNEWAELRLHWVYEIEFRRGHRAHL